jgi:hypothetical protein
MLVSNEPRKRVALEINGIVQCDDYLRQVEAKLKSNGILLQNPFFEFQVKLNV